MSAEARLRELGIVLPPSRTPTANYLVFKRVGALLFLAGQGCREPGGPLLGGKVGSTISVEEAYRRARLCGLMLLTAAREALGSLDKVDGVVKIVGMVNAEPSFVDHPQVINGCSDLFVDVFGEAGRHPRSAFGVASLVKDATVEIDAIFQVRE